MSSAPPETQEPAPPAAGVAPPPPSAGGEDAKRKGLLGGVLRVLFGVVVLALVAQTLPWSDQLLFRFGEGDDAEELSIEGEIEGDWTGEAVFFRPDPEQELEDGWPEIVRESAELGTTIRVTRDDDEALGGAFDWRPSMPRAFRKLDPSGLGKALICFTLAMACAVTRWWRLMALLGCATSWLSAWRLTFLGMFFNLVVPGLTGGDVVKGVIVAHENPGKRGEAFLSVAVDRLIGVFALAALAMVVILVSGDSFAELRLPVVAFLSAGLIGGTCYISGPLRRLVRFDALLARLPLGDKLRELDNAILSYRDQPREMAFAFLISLGNHALVTLGFVALGTAFGVTGVRVVDYFVMVPIGTIVSALPLAPGGWGLGEAVFKLLFEMIGADGGLGVAISVTFRLCMLAYGLVGGVFLLLPGQRRELRESEAGAAAEPAQ
ncbi:MAG: lysylphosphatidylglycerol synthase transmembrane domain-containing protein [Planctomycetota bacterium]